MRHLRVILLGLFVIAPFFILEWVTTAGFVAVGFPTVLFIFMWINSTLFLSALLSGFKDLRAGISKSNALWFSLKVVFLAILASAFVTIVIDQMPCFLGGRGC